jgi:hypothetical protein
MKKIHHLLTAFCLCLSVQGAEYFAAAGAGPGGEGTRALPWTLSEALSGEKSIGAGDTLWLLSGVYRGGFSCELRGKAGAPVVIRGRGRVTIDLTPQDAKSSALFDVKGEHLLFRDLEFTSSHPLRQSGEKGSWPADIKRGSISARGSHLTFANLVVHDLAQGFGFWGNEESGEGGEIYGCLIYNNGWSGPDRGHGHGIYAQNARGVKRLRDNIIFNQFGYGIHAYGSEKAFLRGFHIERNVLFNNGSLHRPDHRASDLAVGGSCPMQDIIVSGNYTFGGGGLRLGYGLDVVNRGITVKDNVIGGSSRFSAIGQMTLVGNQFVAPGTLISWDEGGDQKIIADNNEYVRTTREFAAFNITAAGKTRGEPYDKWRAYIGEGAGSRYVEAKPEGIRVAVKRNSLESGRAHIIVYNWDRAPKVQVDLADVLKKGQRFRIVSAQNYYGTPVVAGIFDGAAVSLPMAPVPAIRPVGMADYAMPVTEPEFGVFVLSAEPGVAAGGPD